jgi:hypothetical protein
VTPKNLVLEDGTNQLKSVDNELLTCSPAYLLDLFNTHYALARSGDGVAQSYLERYSHCVRELPLPGGWESLFVALWTLRLAGTHFQARKFRAAYRLADAAVAGKLDNHPVIQAIREIAAK